MNAKTAPGPLEGIRVLDMATMLAGPYAATLLGDLGADVIKVESFFGDDSRHLGPHREGERTAFMSLNRNKRAVVLDMTRGEAAQEEATGALFELAANAGNRIAITDCDGIGDYADDDDDGDGSPDEEDCEPLDDTISPNAEELCNGIDDNCDDEVDSIPCDDEDPCTTADLCVEGICAGEEITSESAICDGFDEDCDGVTDEDCVIVLKGGLFTDGGEPLSGNDSYFLRSETGTTRFVGTTENDTFRITPGLPTGGETE